jgi:hypothetical protein
MLRKIPTKLPRLLILGLLALSCKQRTAVKSASKDVNSNSENDIFSQLENKYKVVLNFSGKATAVLWDIGVAQQLAGSVGEFHEGKAIFTGNSSGSFMAAYLSCHGLNAKSIEDAKDAFNKMDRKGIPEKLTWYNPEGSKASTKLKKFKSGQRPEIDISGYLLGFIKGALKSENGSICQPVNPVIIVAANAHVLEDRRPNKLATPKIYPDNEKKDLRTSLATKTVDNETLDVFRKDNKSMSLGKACTYFLTSDLYRAYQQMKDLKCDLFEIKTGNDLLYSVVASVSEPTFYFPVAADVNESDRISSVCWHSEYTDPYYWKRGPKPYLDDEKLKQGGLEKTYSPCPDPLSPNYRYYFGGFPMTAPIHDLKRALPNIYAISTGRTALGSQTTGLLEAYFNINTDEAYLYNRYWLDLEVMPTETQVDSMNNYDVPNQETVEQGILATKTCIENDFKTIPDEQIVANCHHPLVDFSTGINEHAQEDGQILPVRAPTSGPLKYSFKNNIIIPVNRSIKDSGLTVIRGK